MNFLISLQRSKKGLGRFFLVLLNLLGSWFDLTLWQITSSATTYQLPDRADVILVLGCGPNKPGDPSSCQIARTSAAVELWQAGYAPTLLLSGGQTGDGVEAQYLAALAQKAGVPASQLILEEKSLNTVENLRFSQQIMSRNNWKTAILVSEPYHLCRARQQAKDQSLKVVGWWPALNSSDWHDFWRRTPALLREAVGLVAYEVLGWLIYS